MASKSELSDLTKLIKNSHEQTTISLDGLKADNKSMREEFNISFQKTEDKIDDVQKNMKADLDTQVGLLTARLEALEQADPTPSGSWASTRASSNGQKRRAVEVAGKRSYSAGPPMAPRLLNERVKNLRLTFPYQLM